MPSAGYEKRKKTKQPSEKLQKKVHDLEDEFKIIKVVPSHPRERLARRVADLQKELTKGSAGDRIYKTGAFSSW